jgi:hypothetical protein
MDVTVDDAGHDEFTAEVRDLSLKAGQAGVIAHIDEFAVFHGKGRGLRVFLVGRKDFRVLNDVVCFHGLSGFIIYS